MAERDLIHAHFAEIDRGDVIAFGARVAGGEHSEGHQVAREIARERGISDPTWVFWHQQSNWVFGGAGDLVAPLLIHWGGDHDRAAAALASLPAPLRVVDGGPEGAFEIHSDTAAARREEPFPDVADTPAVKDRIRAITAQRRTDAEWTAAELAWMNRVLEQGNRAAQGYVVRWIASSTHLTDAAYEALVADWARIYTSAPKDVLVWSLLRAMERRGDPRREEVITTCMTRSRWTFSSGVAHFLTERGDPADIPRLRELALVPGKYVHTPGNGVALRGWVTLRAADERRRESEIAREALEDPAFDPAARRALERIAERGR